MLVAPNIGPGLKMYIVEMYRFGVDSGVSGVFFLMFSYFLHTSNKVFRLELKPG